MFTNVIYEKLSELYMDILAHAIHTTQTRKMNRFAIVYGLDISNKILSRLSATKHLH